MDCCFSRKGKRKEAVAGTLGNWDGQRPTIAARFETDSVLDITSLQLPRNQTSLQLPRNQTKQVHSTWCSPSEKQNHGVQGTRQTSMWRASSFAGSPHLFLICTETLFDASLLSSSSEVRKKSCLSKFSVEHAVFIFLPPVHNVCFTSQLWEDLCIGFQTLGRCLPRLEDACLPQTERSGLTYQI